MVADACNPITWDTEAGKTLSKEKSDSHKGDPPLQISLSFPVLVPLGSAGLLATSPRPLTYLLCLPVNF